MWDWDLFQGTNIKGWASWYLRGTPPIHGVNVPLLGIGQFVYETSTLYEIMLIERTINIRYVLIGQLRN